MIWGIDHTYRIMSMCTVHDITGIASAFIRYKVYNDRELAPVYVRHKFAFRL